MYSPCRPIPSPFPLNALALGAATTACLLVPADSLRAQTTDFQNHGDWSIATNWTNGVPGNGGSVEIFSSDVNGSNTDDITSLTLSSVAQGGPVGPTHLNQGTALTIDGSGLNAYDGSTSQGSANGFSISGGTGTGTEEGATLTFANSAAITAVYNQTNSSAPIFLTAGGSTGHEAQGRGIPYSAGTVNFQGSSSAGVATLVAAAGQAYSVDGYNFVGGAGSFVFTGTASGGTAAVILDSATATGGILGESFSYGTLNVSGLTSSGTTFGSISGSGEILLGSKNISIGSLGASTTFSGVISGNGGSLTLTGGTLNLSGANTYSGGTTLTSGTLQAGAGGTVFGRGSMTVNGGTLDLNGNGVSIASLAGTGGIVTNNGGSAATLTVTGGSGSYAGVLQDGNSSPLALSVTGGTTTLTGTNTYTGGTTVGSGATLQLGNGAVNPGTTAPNGGNLIAGAVTDNGTLAFNFAQNSNYEIDSNLTTPVISGSGGVAMNGSGNLIINSSATYTGGTAVNAGSLSVYTSALGSANGALTINGGKVYFNATDAAPTLNVGALNGTGGTIGAFFDGQDANARLVIGNGNASGSYAGSIQNTPDGVVSFNTGLTKVGTGTQVLSSANTYTYSTQVNGGLLSITSGGSLAATPVTVASGARFNVDGTAGGTASVTGTMSGSGTNTGAVTINDGGTLAPGDGTSTGRLTITAGLTLASGSTTIITLGGTAGGDYSQLYAASLSLGGTLSVTTVNGFTLAPNQTFTILDNTGTGLTTGTFANTPLGQYTDAAGDTFLVSYFATTDGTALNDVTLTVESVVPEPGSWVLLLAGAGLSGVFIRRRGEKRATNRAKTRK